MTNIIFLLFFIVGDLCEYEGSSNPDAFDNFEDFKASLTLVCPDSSSPGTLTWFVELDTPDVVYYQVHCKLFFLFFHLLLLLS